MAQADIGLIGLGVMGGNLALNIADHGFSCAVYNRTTETTKKFMANAGGLAGKLIPSGTMEAFIASIRPPRPVIIMVKAGEPVDQQIALLRPILSANDIIIDAGNANFRDTMRRFDELKDSGLTFIGMGVSGGEEGARHGPSIMVGGKRDSYSRVESVLTAISAKFNGESCCAWLGENGAGHFVKTIHNGIEYADMEMIAEVYGLMRDGLKMPASEIGDVFASWNEGRLNSFLIEITAKVLAASDPESNGPVVDIILDKAGQKGTGRWAVIEAQMMGVPATAIEAAVDTRSLSALKPEREKAEILYRGAEPVFDANDKVSIIRDMEQALFAGKLAAYAQGYAVMAAASKEFGWNLPLDTVSKIWRAGCIIRSQFLDSIATALSGANPPANLLVAPDFVAAMREAHFGWRRTLARAVLGGLPTPALSSARSYFDGYRQSRGTANLIQAQRDFFGAHGFERIGKSGEHHGPWGLAAGKSA
jgi:6-phosphogluconate dehydrogenase